MKKAVLRKKRQKEEKLLKKVESKKNNKKEDNTIQETVAITEKNKKVDNVEQSKNIFNTFFDISKKRNGGE